MAQSAPILLFAAATESFMGLFNASLYRSFALGFVLGAFGLFLTMGSGDDGLTGGMVGHAVAAPASSD